MNSRVNATGVRDAMVQSVFNMLSDLVSIMMDRL